MQLEYTNRILFLDLRPWLITGVSDLKYRQDLLDINRPKYHVQPLFELDFLKPLNSKRKYYMVLIDTDAILYLNNLHIKIREAINEKAKRYHVHMALTRTLNEKLKEVALVIKDHDYSRKQYDYRLGSLPANSLNTDSAFIIGYLQHQLVRLYLEVQEFYPNFLLEEPLAEEDIYLKYFNHGSFTPSYIKGVPQSFIETPGKNPLVTTEPLAFKPFKRDVRAENPKILKYDDIIKEPEKFALLEITIFNEKLIDEKYNYQLKPRGNNNKMAAVWVVAFKKGYFSKYFFKGGKQNVEFKHVRDFLSNRYNTDIDQEPRKLFRNADELQKILDRNPWITLIPPV